MGSRRASSPHRRRRLAVALACSIAVAVGCGGEGSDMEQASPTRSTTAGDPRGAFEAELRQGLLADQALSADQVDCVISKLEGSLSDRQIAEISSGQLSGATQQELARATTRCVAQGP